MSEISTYIFTIHVIELAAIALMSFTFFKKRCPEIKIVGLIALLQLLVFLGQDLFGSLGWQQNIPHSITAIVNFLLLTYVYYLSFRRQHGHILLTVSILYFVFGIINLAFVQQVNTNTYTLAVSALLTMIYGLFYFYRLLVDLPVQHLQRMPMFWITSGFLIGNAGTFFLYLVTSHVSALLLQHEGVYDVFIQALAVMQYMAIMIGLLMDVWNLKTSAQASVR